MPVLNQYIINGSRPFFGEITISGAKNAAVAIIPAALLVYGASRFKYLDELRRMGAHIQVDGRVAVIEGIEHLEGAPVHACDLRAGAALVIAGLAARGTTEISQIQFIERGYEDLVGKLRAVGADIQMVDVPVEAAESEAQIS